MICQNESIPHESRKAGVVVVAAGKGERLGTELPKQFLSLMGLPIFMHSLMRFASCDFVTQIVLVVPKQGLSEDFKLLLNKIHKPLICVHGGERRQDSVAKGLSELRPPYDIALVHDAARPFPDLNAIKVLIEAGMKTGGGLLAIRCPDTVKQAKSYEKISPEKPILTIEKTLDRSMLWLAQTPQAIRNDLVQRAIASFTDPELNVTDEAGLLESWGIDVALIESTSNNIKITYPSDLPLANAIAASLGITEATFDLDRK